MRGKALGALAALLALAAAELPGAVVAGALARPAVPALVERRVAVMGTVLGVAVTAPTRDRALAASESAIREIQRVEDLLTTWRDSPLSRIADAPAGSRVPVDSELFDVLQRVLAWSARTGGTFDPTVAPLVRVWDLRGPGRIPSPAELDAALDSTGPSAFRLDASDRSIRRRDARAGIEEGGWGKGYGLDGAARMLREPGTGGALLDLGGQVLALGRNAGGAPWTVAIADPRHRGRRVLVLRLENASVATSGDSERGRQIDGVRIGHLLDPRTGRPAPDFGSVTVVAPSALEGDILSTAFFVLGPDAGLALSDRLRCEGVPNEVLYLVVRGDALEARYSPGLPDLVISADTTVVRGLSTER